MGHSSLSRSSTTGSPGNHRVPRLFGARSHEADDMANKNSIRQLRCVYRELGYGQCDSAKH
ncbi:hypothetical protein I7I50_03011 [Histoplasma capsulatum G186AR]|uniref:Uncharacterized protein n=1 Tax=Ajellomyces capsulatus TaxID=5037 RepID=A0A8H8D7K0_AJECA|nr:hypothetical protein I7I52_00323 [Histoplasma capsulatum]QSS71971.1 hypothetical protein I7I50_03011 [Histoplasma capsulatum G186AR]